MSINTNAYGAASDWKDIFLQSNVPEDERVRMALFLEEPYPTTLPGGITPDDRNGYEIGNAFWRMDNDSSYSILDENNPNLMDRSTTFVGIGGDSPYTKIRYISNEYTDSPLPDKVDVVDQGQDEFDVVNTFFTAGTFGSFGNNRTAFQVFQGETGGGSQREPYYRSVMWSPNRYDGTIISGNDYPKFFYANNHNDARNSQKIITQLPTKRIVWYPTITCSDNNDENISTYDMHDYLTAYKSIKPRILSVQMVPVMDIREDITVPITVSTQRSASIPHLGLGLNMELHGNLDGKWIGAEGSRTEINSENPIIDMFVGCDRGVALGGYITGKRYDTNANPYLGQPSSTGSFDVQAIIDCGDMEWRSWSGEGNGKSNEYLFCDASNLTAEQIQESVRRAIACFGMFFADSQPDARQLELNANGMFLGTIEDDGVGRGEYSEGLENMEQPQWNWKTMDENEYDPTVPPGPGPEPGDDPAASDNPLLPVGLDWTLANTGTGIWALTPSEIGQVWKDIFGTTADLSKFGDQPMNAILSLKWTPFTWSTNGNSPIILGDQIVNDIHTYPLVDSVGEAEQHGYGQMRFKFNKNFYNARNIQARLFLPFYGYYELPAAQLLSSQLRVDFYYNIPDDLGVWIISYDKVIYDFVECSCDMDIPLTGSNAAAIRENKKSEALTIATQVASTLVTLGNTSLSNLAGGATVNAINQYGGVGSIMSSAQGSLGSKLSTAAAYGAGKLASTALPYAGVGITGAVNVYNIVRQAQIQRAALRTNLPYHGSALQTTFLHMSMTPYVQIFKNTIMDGLTTSNGGTVKVELGGTSEDEYMLKVGHACDIFTTIDKMPENSLLQTTGLANNSTAGMELAEVNELNTILQSGFLR